MLSNRGRDTTFELSVRRILYAMGLRYRVDFRVVQQVRSRADVAFPGRHIAVYFDGCFWHGCPVHATAPKTNAAFWAAKLLRNIERDRAVDVALAESGWLVLRYWEHEDPNAIAVDIAEQVGQRNLKNQGEEKHRGN